MKREGLSGPRLSQEGTSWLRSRNPAEFHGEESQAGTDSPSLVLSGCTELKSFFKTHLAAPSCAL